jgi:hypothetical protein
MQRLFSRIIKQRTYVEQPQGFEVYMEETFVCIWKETTWWRTSNAQQKRGEWSRLRNQDNYSSLLEKNSPYSSSSMFYFLREYALPDLTYVSGRMDQMIQFIYHNNVFLCRLMI